MKKINVNLKRRSYRILIGEDILGKTGDFLKKFEIGTDAFIITNSVIKRLYHKTLENSLKKNGFRPIYEIIPDTEKSKSQKQFLKSANRLGKKDRGGRCFIIAFGGGVVGDLSGYIAAVYRRGIPYIQIPTTLLGQVDSAIGGKTGIDLDAGKNLIGTFYQPKLVICDISILRSLSVQQVRYGMAEVIKYGVIANGRLFEYLENNYESILKLETGPLEKIITECAAIKARVVEEDEFEIKKKRCILNYGHTIGHAIEAASGYSKRYSHGEAIAIGMLCAAEIALKMGIINIKDVIRIEDMIFKVGLPTTASGVSISKILSAYWHDKKFVHGKSRFVLPRTIGNVGIFEDISVNIVKDVLKKRIS